MRYLLTSEKKISHHTRLSFFLICQLMFVFLAGTPATGQSSYTFTASSGTFTQISGTTMPLGGTSTNEGYFNSIPIGFSFNYWGNTYTTASASTNGWLTFGQNITNPNYNNNLNSGTPRPLIAPLWDNLSMLVNTDFSYLTTGSEGSRIFTAQWLNMKWSYNATGAVISFQVKLYESSGMIEFIYRQEGSGVSSGSSASIGIAATSTGPNNFYSVQSTGPLATVSTQNEVNFLNTKPATGQIFAFTPSIAQIDISSSDPAIAGSNILQNSFNNIIYSFNCSVTTANAILEGLQVSTSGSYTAADLNYLIAWYSDDATFSENDLMLSMKDISLGPGIHVFPYFIPQQINVGQTGYIFITADVNCAAVQGHTISVAPVATSDITFQSGTKTGTTFAGEDQTIQYSIPSDVLNPSAAPDGTTADLTWNNPEDCYDEIMIVGKTSSITASPTGNGSAYTANLAFGSGTTFDGGYIIYKGTASPQTVTNLLEGTTYYFKFFSRKGTNWSNGNEINITTTAAATGNFRSIASGNWNSTSTWEYYDGTWGPAATTPSATSGTISIRSGNNVTVSADVSADQVIVDAGGTLSINNLITFTVLDGTGTDCTVNGILVNSGNITTTGSIVFNSTGVYNHAKNGGPVPTATWNSGSTCSITGSISSAPTNLNQAFYNFTWNCAGQSGNISLGGYPSNVPGTFAVNSTGSGAAKLSPGGNATYGNYLQTSGNYSLLGGIATARTITISNFTLQGGTFTMSDATAIGTANVSGNFTHTAGTITESSSGSGSIVFNGSAMQTYTSGGAVNSMINFTVNPNAYLQMATAGTVIPGTGSTFTLSASATLGVTSPLGINVGYSGNIQTRTKAFNAAANYIFNGIGDQESGDAITFTNLTGNVTIATSSVIKFMGDMFIDGSLTVNGTLIPGEEYFVIDGSGTLNGSGTVVVNRTSETADFLSQYLIAGKNLTSLTVEYSAPAGGQIVSSTTYSKLKLGNTSGTNTLGGNVGVTSNLTTTTNGTIVVGSGQLLTASNVSNAGILTIAASGKATIGNLVNTGTLNLYSTGASENFSLMMDNYSGSGSANISLFLTGGGDPDYKWHYVAVPSNTAKTVFTSINAEDLMLYDESKVTTSINQGWMWNDGYDNTEAFTDLFVKKGYSFYHSAPSATVNFNGLTSLTTSLGSISLAYSGSSPALHGFNLLGNSLTCGLDWNQVTETGDVDNTVYYIKDYREATYLRNVGGINGGTKDIPPLQGFIVKANASGTSLNFTNARQHTSQVRYKGSIDSKGSRDEKEAEPVSLVRLQLNNLVSQDEALVWFDENATNSFEGDYDARKFSSSDSFDQIYTLAGTTMIGINGLPLPAEVTTIPVAVQFRNSGTTYKIIANDLQGLDQYRVTLTDKYNSNFITDLKTNPEYSFSSGAGTFTDRFVLTISNLATTADDDVTISIKPFSIYAGNGILNVRLLDKRWENMQGMISIYNLSGNKVFTDSKVEWSYGDLKQFSLPLPKGMYVVEIKTEKEKFVSKINLF